jgi:hypothetical protein
MCGKGEEEHFKTKCTPAGTELKYLAMKYLKFKLQLKCRYNEIKSPIPKIFKEFKQKKYIYINSKLKF